MLDIIEEIRHSLAQDLPGERAHQLMNIRGRLPASDALHLDPPPRNSAVMLILFPENNKWNLVLIQRPDYDGVHSGQIAFPGGKAEPGDTDLLSTAMRESQEEIGINTDELIPVGSLSTVYIPPSNFLVHPFVSILPAKPNLIPDPREVQDIIYSPASQFIGDEKVQIYQVPMQQSGLIMKVPAYQLENHIVWGATAMILAEFMAVCGTILQKHEP